jgi:hypothetical protein
MKHYVAGDLAPVHSKQRRQTTIRYEVHAPYQIPHQHLCSVNVLDTAAVQFCRHVLTFRENLLPSDYILHTNCQAGNMVTVNVLNN